MIDITDKDNAAHPDYFKNGSEWWYACFHDDNLNLHGSLILKTNTINTFVSLSVIDHPNLSFFERISTSAINVSSEFCDVKMGQNSFVQTTSDEYAIHMESFDKNITFDIKLKALTRGFLCEGQNIFWAVSVPLAHMTGEIVCDGVRQELQGRGYHDHNWGAEDEKDVSWKWGEIANVDNKISVVFGQMNIPGKIHENIVVVSDENGFRKSVKPHAKIDSIETARHGNHWYPTRQNIIARSDGVEVDIQVIPRKGVHADSIDIFLADYRGSVILAEKKIRLDTNGFWEYKYVANNSFMTKILARMNINRRFKRLQEALQ